MTRSALALTPLRLALRRLRRRPAPARLLAVSVAARAALAQERSVRLRLDERTPAQRAFRVRYFVPALEPDSAALFVAAATAGLGDVATRPHVVRIGHPVAPH